MCLEVLVILYLHEILAWSWNEISNFDINEHLVVLI